MPDKEKEKKKDKDIIEEVPVPVSEDTVDTAQPVEEPVEQGRGTPQIALPRGYDTGEDVPEEIAQQRAEFAKGGIYNTPAPDVKPAKDIPDVPWWQKAVAGATAIIPGVGQLASIPLQKSVTEKNARINQDKAHVARFFDAIKTDKKLAKEYLRMPRVRDALQRIQGMSGEEIMDLDASMTEEGLFTQKDILLQIMKGGATKEGGYETEVGKFETPPQPGMHKVDARTGLMVNTGTGEVNLKASKDMFDQIYDRVLKNTSLTPEDAFLYATGLMNPQNKQKRTTFELTSDGTGAYLFDNITNKGKMLATGHKARGNWLGEKVVDPMTNIPTGVILHNKNAKDQDELEKTSTLLMFNLVKKPDGSTRQDDIDRIMRENAGKDNRGAISKMIDSVIGKFFPVTDNAPGMQLTPNSPAKSQGQGGVERPPAQAVEQPPARAPVQAQGGTIDKDETAKKNSFFIGE